MNQLDGRLKDFKDIFATKEDLANTKKDMIKWKRVYSSILKLRCVISSGGNFGNFLRSIK